jgi:hypothetical protein
LSGNATLREHSPKHGEMSEEGGPHLWSFCLFLSVQTPSIKIFKGRKKRKEIVSPEINHFWWCLFVCLSNKCQYGSGIVLGSEDTEHKKKASYLGVYILVVEKKQCFLVIKKVMSEY